MNRDPTLCRAFITEGMEILSGRLEVQHEWSIDQNEDHCILNIPKQTDDGFDIRVEVCPDQITVYGEGTHRHFDFTGSLEIVDSAFGLARDLLSPHMRIRELRAAGSPYRWFMESFQSDRWFVEQSTGLFFWNYFGQRSERILQNRILEGRLDSV